MIQRLRNIVAALHRLVEASGALIDDATPSVGRTAHIQLENSR
ncbi:MULTISPECIES: hypothetical protein [unclassified Variovorax]|nr:MULTISPECIES: hypothetical protein [unclassified Variovorax]